MITLVEVQAAIDIRPEYSALELAKFWCIDKDDVLEFLRIYQDFIGPIE